MQSHPIGRVLTRAGTLIASPPSFAILGLYTVLWLILSPQTFDWQAIATLVTWLMTLLINRSEHRDTQAIQAKLDELLRVNGDAKNELMTVDQREPEEIIQQRDKAQRSDEAAMRYRRDAG